MIIPSLTMTPPQHINGTTTVIEWANTADSPYKFIGPGHFAQSVSVQIGCNAVLEDISNLKDNWDGYGALAPTAESCAHVRSFLAGADIKIPAPEVRPTSNGTINLEWQSSEGSAFLEVGRTRYAGHIQPRRGATIFLEGQLSHLQETLAPQQLLAIVGQLLYAASGSKIPANSIYTSESSF